MTYTGQVSFDYNPRTSVAVVVWDPGMEYRLDTVVHEVQSQAPGVRRILVYEGDLMVSDMRRRRLNSRWADSAGERFAA